MSTIVLCPDPEEQEGKVLGIPAGDANAQDNGDNGLVMDRSWHTRNEAYYREGQDFRTLLRALCDTVTQPEHVRGRPQNNWGDTILYLALWIYGQSSGRRALSVLNVMHELGFSQNPPAYGTLSRYINMEALTPVLADLVTVSATPLVHLERSFSVDSTGFGSTAPTPTWRERKWGKASDRKSHVGTKRREWTQLHAMVGNASHIFTAAVVTPEQSGDAPRLPILVEQTAKYFTIERVSGDRGYTSKMNLQAIVDAGGIPYIRFKDGARFHDRQDLWNKLLAFFLYYEDHFRSVYGERNNIESAFSNLKLMHGELLRSKASTARVNEVYLKVVCHNLVTLCRMIHQVGIKPIFLDNGFE